jgi:hypothetical protein
MAQEQGIDMLVDLLDSRSEHVQRQASKVAGRRRRHRRGTPDAWREMTRVSLPPPPPPRVEGDVYDLRRRHDSG